MFLKGSPTYFRFFHMHGSDSVMSNITSKLSMSFLSLIWLFTSHYYSLCAAANSREHWRREILEQELEWSVVAKVKRPEPWVQHVGGEVSLSGLKSESTTLGRSMGQSEAPTSVDSSSPEASLAATPQHLTNPILLTLRNERKQCELLFHFLWELRQRWT